MRPVVRTPLRAWGAHQGWSLERYAWDPTTGVGHFHYVNEGTEEQFSSVRDQRRYWTSGGGL